MNIENYIIDCLLSIPYWLFPVSYALLAIAYCLLPVDCLSIALDAHMLSHNGYGPGPRAQGPRSVPGTIDRQ